MRVFLHVLSSDKNKCVSKVIYPSKLILEDGPSVEIEGHMVRLCHVIVADNIYHNVFKLEVR